MLWIASEAESTRSRDAKFSSSRSYKWMRFFVCLLVCFLIPLFNLYLEMPGKIYDTQLIGISDKQGIILVRVLCNI